MKASQSDTSHSRRINFLLVDDLEANLVALEAILEMEGLNLLKARSGREALELLLVHDVALAFVDVQMPEMTGFELAEVMRSTERTKTVPIIFLTAGTVDQQRRIRGYETGAVDFLPKPIDPMILLNKAATFYQLARQREELKENESHLLELNEKLARTNAELERADRSKDEFLAMLAHELRNPIAPILAGVDVLLKSPGDEKMIGSIAGMMRRQTSQMAHLIDDLLDVSRITTGKIELQKEDVPVREFIETALESVQPLIKQFDHELITGEIDGLWALHGDPHRLVQVVANLLTNAAKYTPAGGRIRLRVDEVEGEKVSIRVADNGKGIRPEMQARIFDLFDQGGAGPKDGLGIGLTLVRTLVDMHDGTISVVSEGEGKGSEFTVELPGLIRMGAVAPADVAAVAESFGKLRVLIADDGHSTVNILKVFFRLEGMETAVAYDGAEAIEVARDFRPDLVCLDLGMPTVDGYEAARRIREIHPAAHIVALSGWGSEEDRRRTAEAGFDEHLTKPVCPDDLRGLMARTLAK